MGRIPQEIIDQILDRLDIVEVVSEYIQLKKAGRNFKANCPFHNEKTPSFIVSAEKQIYHCFGCHAGGNVIGFVMQYEKMEFPEAVKMLAERAGVELPKYEKADDAATSLASQLYELNNLAAGFYQDYLRSDKGKKALDYMKKRGLSSENLSEFRIGYAPEGWEVFTSYATARKIAPALLRKAGLTIPSEKGKGDYDRFRGRITFPIFNERGSIVAFGARVMDSSLPKYINSPETLVYNKSNILYGLNFAKRGIREKGYAIIVEGYLDVIIPFQYGVTNVVATSGTALTQRQASMLKKYTDTAVMVFDADQAGESASLRGLDIFIENGMKVKVATLPKGEDPDSFVRKNGKEGFEKITESAKGLFDYKLDLLIGKLGAKEIAGIVDEMLPTIARVENEVVKSDYLKKLSERLGVHEASLRYEMGKVRLDYSYRYEEQAKVDRASHNWRGSEVHLLGLAITDKKMFQRIETELGLDKFRDSSVRKVMILVRDLFAGGQNRINPGKLLSRLENEKTAKAAAVQAIAKADITRDPEKALVDCMYSLRKENREEELKGLTIRLKKAQAMKDEMEMKELLVKINKIHKEKVT